MNRSIYKGPYVEQGLLRKIKKMADANVDFGKVPIKTYSRRSTILPSFVGRIFEIHNGNRFVKVYITEAMIGHKLGEFSPTRAIAKHAVDKGKGKIKPKGTSKGKKK